MVAFAPTVSSPNIAATADPEYTSYRWSRPIGEFAGNKSSEIALKGAGEALERGTEAADSLIKNTLDQSIEKNAGALQDAHKATLERTLAMLSGNATDPQGQQKATLLTTAPKTDQLPSDVKNLPTKLEAVAARKDNGSISETQYRGAVDTLAKQYRNAWPGYTDYIDSEFDRVTERGVASKYIQSMTADINAYASAAKEARSKDEALLQHAIEVDHIPQAAQWYQLFQAGKMDGVKLRQMYSTEMAWKYTAEQKKAEAESADIDDKQRVKLVKDWANHTLTNTAAGVIATIDAASNPDKIVSEVSNGKLDPMQAEKLGTSYEAIRIQTEKKMMDDLMNTKDPKTGRTMYDVLGPEGAKQIIEDNPLIRHLKQQTELLVGTKDHSVAMLSHNWMAAKISYDRQGLAQGDTDASKIFNALNVWQGVGGDAASKLIADQIADGNLVPAMKEWYARYGIAMPANPDPATGQVTTMNDAFEEALKKGQDNPHAFRLFLDRTAASIADPSVPIRLKEGYMNGAYDPRNLALLERIQPDTIDPQTKRRIPGAATFFTSLTGDKQASEVSRISQITGHPQLWDRYVNYVEGAGEYFVGTELPKLDRGFDAAGVSVTYDSTNQRFKVTPMPVGSRPKGPIAGFPGASLGGALKEIGGRIGSQFRNVEAEREAQASVDNINKVIKSLATMYKYDTGNKEDVNAYIAHHLIAMAPKGTVSEKMLNALMAATTKPQQSPEE